MLGRKSSSPETRPLYQLLEMKMNRNEHRSDRGGVSEVEEGL